MADLELHDDWLRCTFETGHADFHYRWLRHQSPEARHPITGERTLCSSEIPDGVRPKSARIEHGELVIVWAPDGSESRYDLGWLAEHAYARDRKAVPPPPSDVRSIEIDGQGDLAAIAARALQVVAEHGAVVVRRSVARPEDETEGIIDAFGAHGLRVVGTHFGRIEDLRTDNTTNRNTDQLGYTDAPVHLHTDQPFLEHPPRWQLLHSIRVADEGGENLVADALAAARWLESVDEHAARLLRTTPVRFHRKQKAFEKILEAPILHFGEDGSFLVRASYFTLAPYDLPFAQMTDWYRAHDAFFRLVRDPRHHYRFRLSPGDFVLYDNHRMLHARTAFRGARWVRGIYFDSA